MKLVLKIAIAIVIAPVVAVFFWGAILVALGAVAAIADLAAGAP